MSHRTQWYLQNRLLNRTLFLKPWLQCLVGTWAVMCSMTRVSDNRHHWWDVLAGTVLGFLFGLFVVVISCRHFCLDRAVNVAVSATHVLNESLENGQTGGYDMQRKHSVKKLLNPVVVDVSEGRRNEGRRDHMEGMNATRRSHERQESDFQG